MHRPLRSPLSATVLVTQVTAMRLRSIRKLVSIALGLIVLGCLWFYLAPTSIGGSSTYVVTNGVSMEPRFHTGDLAVVRSQSSYHVGEIVAYHNKMFHTVVLHRIVGRDGNRYLFKGDNNNFVDFEHPLASQLIGRLWLHIPGGGSRLKSIRSPALVGVLVALGMLLISGAVFTRQRRRRRRQTQLGESADAPPAHPHRSIEPLVGVLGIGLLALVPFVVLALLAFTHPLTALRPFKIPYKQSGRFSYSADATPGPAYPGTGPLPANRFSQTSSTRSSSTSDTGSKRPPSTRSRERSRSSPRCPPAAAGMRRCRSAPRRTSAATTHPSMRTSTCRR